MRTPRVHPGDPFGRSPDLRVDAEPRLPGVDPQWHLTAALTAYSCGGSHGFGDMAPHRIPFNDESPRRTKVDVA